ncbi:MAG: hypothetical protein H7327_01635 [Herminiimonas sp.]|nr:hypothetical protein [Herminiimonas sp.]
MATGIRHVATVDKRPFFEKALSHGVQNGLLDEANLRTIIADGAKGTVQVAAHFGSSHLQADLDNARRRVVNLVSLFLEETCDGNLQRAAESLRDNGFLFHSRSGNDLLKALHQLPASTIVSHSEDEGFKQFQDLRTLTQPYTLRSFRAERQLRQDNDAMVRLAFWFADQVKLARAALADSSSEAVIRTAILIRAGKGERYGSRGAFATLVDSLRTKAQKAKRLVIPESLLDDVPEGFREIAAKIRRKIVRYDVPMLLDAELPLEALFRTFESRYFMDDSGLEDVDNYDALVSKAWHKVTKGKEDPYSRLTIFMCIATGIKPKPVVSELEARKMVRQVRKNGFDSAAVVAFIRENAPFELGEALVALWEDEFLPEAAIRLCDEADTTLERALQFLADQCMVNRKDKTA